MKLKHDGKIKNRIEKEMWIQTQQSKKKCGFRINNRKTNFSMLIEISIVQAN